MQDEEYPAYLKKQSYDDLISISCSLDKEAQAKRYEMVLAEMAERDKRGEKPKTNWHRHASLSIGVCFLMLFVSDLISSKTGWKPAIHLAIGIICLIMAWFERMR